MLGYPFALPLTSITTENQEKSPLLSPIRALLQKGQGTIRTALLEEGLHGGLERRDALLVDVPAEDQILTILVCTAGAIDTPHPTARNLMQDAQLRIASCLPLTRTSNQGLYARILLCIRAEDR